MDCVVGKYEFSIRIFFQETILQQYLNVSMRGLHIFRYQPRSSSERHWPFSSHGLQYLPSPGR